MRIGHIQNISVTYTLQVSNRLWFRGFLNHRLCLPHFTWYFLINFLWINQLLWIHLYFWHPNHPMIMTSNAEDTYYGLFCFFYIYFLRISPQVPQFLFLLKTEPLSIILFSNAMSLNFLFLTSLSLRVYSVQPLPTWKAIPVFWFSFIVIYFF